jgi:hypothetical protein
MTRSSGDTIYPRIQSRHNALLAAPTDGTIFARTGTVTQSIRLISRLSRTDSAVAFAISFPDELPCAGCRYKLILPAADSVLHCNISEFELERIKENKLAESAAYHETAHPVIAGVQKMRLDRRGLQGLRIDQRDRVSPISSLRKPKAKSTSDQKWSGSEPFDRRARDISLRKDSINSFMLLLGLRSTVGPLRDHELRLRRIERCQFHPSIRYSRRRARRQRRRTRLCPEVIHPAFFGFECNGRGVIVPARLKRRLLACAQPVLAGSN